MRRWLAALGVLVVLWAPLVQAQETGVVAGLSQHQVSLTTDFSGSELFIYGTAKGAKSKTPLDFIVTVTGPEGPVTVRKKEWRLGIWINGDGVRIQSAPSFYAVASTKTFDETVGPDDNLKYSIGLDYVIRQTGRDAFVPGHRDYRNAVVRIRQEQGLYVFLPNTIKVLENTLFETRIKLPANLVEGDYTARIFLIQDRHVVDVFEDKIVVRRAGLGRLIYSSAQDYPALYGIFSIAIALFAGWLASAFFRTFFPL